VAISPKAETNSYPGITANVLVLNLANPIGKRSHPKRISVKRRNQAQVFAARFRGVFGLTSTLESEALPSLDMLEGV
jgi:hypothetical protein